MTELCEFEEHFLVKLALAKPLEHLYSIGLMLQPSAGLYTVLECRVRKLNTTY